MENLYTVVEFPGYTKKSEEIFDEEERNSIINHLSRNPLAGAIIPETGGCRKVRWGSDGRGKRGGSRVIYYFYDGNNPVVIIDVYAKKDKTDLSQDDKKYLRSVAKKLKDNFSQKGVN